jgi:NAD(P)-dependent dehydrogenase (short-subunit alcohol dehydrogenase family)
VHGQVADVALDQDRQQLLDWIGGQWGALDTLVNNAGINIRRRAAEYSREEYMKILEIDLLGGFELCRLLLPLLQKGQGASVINIASVAGSFDLYTGAPYGMSKAGLIQLSRHLAVIDQSIKTKNRAVSLKLPCFVLNIIYNGNKAAGHLGQINSDGTPKGENRYYRYKDIFTAINDFSVGGTQIAVSKKW